MAIYEKVKSACKEKGISISELENALGFARSTIYKWNTNVPSVEKMNAVAEKLEKPIEYFLE